MAITEFFSPVTVSAAFGAVELRQNLTTSSSSNGILLVMISMFRSDIGVGIQSVTFDATNFVLAESAMYSANTHRSWIYYDLAPGSNTDDLVVSFDNKINGAWMTIIGYEGVDQTTPFDDTSALSGTCGTTCDLTLSPTNSGNKVIGSLFHGNNGAPTPSYGYMTTEGQSNNEYGSHSVSSSTGQASSTDLRWNASVVDGFAFTGVALNPSGGAGYGNTINGVASPGSVNTVDGGNINTVNTV